MSKKRCYVPWLFKNKHILLQTNYQGIRLAKKSSHTNVLESIFDRMESFKSSFFLRTIEIKSIDFTTLGI